jgi:hypothetical protein
MKGRSADPSTWERQLTIGLVLKGKCREGDWRPIYERVLKVIGELDALKMTAQSVYWNDEKVLEKR